ncbi:hypothetical protein LL965_10470 [Xanthomonas cassavae CFBP 4642]|uniref:TNase-like domain-containing protein n=1 Tax=Xanthomonas cassavae CFBP 4642 TaxID=1219375 RepID=A0ABS8HFS9_9XANT|nr:hypothetical protein [Xanthomonas cassavae]MCC4620487.1 hypothetical protein [Xanthomonas cassavae CFBP 4642]
MQSKDVQARDADGDPIYRKNPHPKQAYRITMTIENAPGPFKWVSGTAFYEIKNHEKCTPVEPITGAWSKSKRDGIPINFDRVTEAKYVAVIYLDGLIDSNYYGKGVCYFELAGVGATIKATGKKEETRFQSSLFASEILDQKSKATYFWSRGYPRDEVDDFPDQGEPGSDHFREELRDELFKVALSVRKGAL